MLWNSFLTKNIDVHTLVHSVVAEPLRRHSIAHSRTYTCLHLAEELRKRGWNRIDYMTIDTEGSELSLVLDFPWNEFDVRVIQVEQLSEVKFRAQKGRKDKIIQHLQSVGYKLLSVYPVARYDTDDLILTRNVDDFIAQTSPHKHDGDYSIPKVTAESGKCTCQTPPRWSSQSMQDQYVWERVLQPQNLCCKGVFVEFGARNGVEHSNTWSMEKFQGWTGLLMEVDNRETPKLKKNRPNANVIQGAVCPRHQQNVTILVSRIGGWTGSELDYGASMMRGTISSLQVAYFLLANMIRSHHVFVFISIRTYSKELGRN